MMCYGALHFDDNFLAMTAKRNGIALRSWVWDVLP
jgi:hypothetical protein